MEDQAAERLKQEAEGGRPLSSYEITLQIQKEPTEKAEIVTADNEDGNDVIPIVTLGDADQRIEPVEEKEDSIGNSGSTGVVEAPDDKSQSSSSSSDEDDIKKEDEPAPKVEDASELPHAVPSPSSRSDQEDEQNNETETLDNVIDEFTDQDQETSNLPDDTKGNSPEPKISQDQEPHSQDFPDQVPVPPSTDDFFMPALQDHELSVSKSPEVTESSHDKEYTVPESASQVVSVVMSSDVERPPSTSPDEKVPPADSDVQTPTSPDVQHPPPTSPDVELPPPISPDVELPPPTCPDVELPPPTSPDVELPPPTSPGEFPQMTSSGVDLPTSPHLDPPPPTAQQEDPATISTNIDLNESTPIDPDTYTPSSSDYQLPAPSPSDQELLPESPDQDALLQTPQYEESVSSTQEDSELTAIGQKPESTLNKEPLPVPDQDFAVQVLPPPTSPDEKISPPVSPDQKLPSVTSSDQDVVYEDSREETTTVVIESQVDKEDKVSTSSGGVPAENADSLPLDVVNGQDEDKSAADDVNESNVQTVDENVKRKSSSSSSSEEEQTKQQDSGVTDVEPQKENDVTSNAETEASQNIQPVDLQQNADADIIPKEKTAVLPEKQETKKQESPEKKTKEEDAEENDPKRSGSAMTPDAELADVPLDQPKTEEAPRGEPIQTPEKAKKGCCVIL